MEKLGKFQLVDHHITFITDCLTFEYLFQVRLVEFLKFFLIELLSNGTELYPH